MRKYLIYNLAALALILGTFVACNTAEQDVEPVSSPDGYPKFTFAPAEIYSAVKEGDTLIFNVTTDKMIDRALTFSANIIDGDADEDDIIVTNGVVAPYSTSTSVSIIIPEDYSAEATESISLEFGLFSLAEMYLVHQSMDNPVVDLTIANYVSPELIITIGWEQAISGMEGVSGETQLPNGDIVEWVDTVAAEYDAHDYMDFDILISSADSFDYADPWASALPNYSAATGSNPEVFTAVLKDGEYILWTDLWYNELYDPEVSTFVSYDDSTLTVGMNANFVRQGTALDVNIDMAEPNIPFVFQPGALLSYNPDVYTGFAFNGIIAKIVAADGVYTIVNYSDETVYGAARKSANSKTPRPMHLRR